MNKLPTNSPSSEAEEDAGQNDRLFVTALARGLQVLRCFTPVQRELRAAEIARMTGLPQPTVWRLCHTLIQLGYLVSSTKNDRLQLGTGVLALGYSALAAAEGYEALKPRMQAIADKYESAVSLAARDGLAMVYIQRCQGNSMLRMNLHVGSQVPLINTSLGWAYLAALGAEARMKAIKQLAASDPALWQKIEPAVMKAMRETEEKGYLLNLGDFRPEINAVAIPVVSYDGSKILTLNCSGFASMLSAHTLESEIAPQLLDIAATARMILSQNS